MLGLIIMLLLFDGAFDGALVSVLCLVMCRIWNFFVRVLSTLVADVFML